jgi:hypothetical protein
MGALDATGNEMRYSDRIYTDMTNGLVFCATRYGSLSPSEVWRVTIKLKNEKGFPVGQGDERSFEFLARPTRE